MRPKKLTMCAWGPYRNKQEIDFTAFEGKGIFLITGATGAGKTTIFDAITYALYGALSGDERDKERAGVRSDFADPQTPTYVELIMEHGGAEYRILRNPEYMRPKKRGRNTSANDDTGLGENGKSQKREQGFTKEKDNAILYYPDGRILEGTREVNGALQELLVLDYQQFKKISMIAQGEFAKLLVAPPKEKTKIFREIFGTGVYERFTTELGVRSRALYAQVMEQKNKLEEDIRLLTVGLEKSSWSEDTKACLMEIVSSAHWNYETLEECLHQMEAEAAKLVAEQKKIFAKTDKEVEKLATAISKETENNRRIEQFVKVSEEMKSLQDLANEYKEKENRYQLAVNAGFVEVTEMAQMQGEGQLANNHAEQKRLRDELAHCGAEAKELENIVQRADKIRGLLEKTKELQTLKLQLAQKEKQAAMESDTLQKGQEDYLQQEVICQQYKAKYEEEDHRRKLAAIGLAAALLKEGCPCPVCGSTSHPKPAKIEEAVISEDELKKLKVQYEKAEDKLKVLHGQLVTVKTRLEEIHKQQAQLTAQCSGIGQLLQETDDEVCREFISMSVETAEALLMKKCERANTLIGLIQEKNIQINRLLEQEKELGDKLAEIRKEFGSALRKYGFQNKEAYIQAKLLKEEREALQRELDNYRSKVAANKELYQHLKGTVEKEEPADLNALRTELDEIRAQKDEALKQQKVWERQLAEVKKAFFMMKDKRQSMEEASAEYGYVKDLENMANGNNAKKLVFEQYVLAGYFEEILRAANVRFRNMTTGRYEMSRIGEVGDGRIKDNLEIQVMDYYTGKYRSVRTLSGGESFKAALSLALGMSDVIQAMNGGIRVDTLFVDEGFGALDEESLDQACNTLIGLAENDCLIGIISHVPQLRERISQQLIIDKTSSGSLVRNAV